jgi:N-methylhydantoinase A
VLSALGLLAAPVTVDRARAHLGDLHDPAQRNDLAAVWEGLAADARAGTRAQGLTAATVTRSADLRYHGQAFELEVPAEGLLGSAGVDLEGLAARFHAAHEERYGYRRDAAVIEVVTLRVRAEGPTPDLPLPPLTGGGDVAAATLVEREVLADGGVTVRAPVVDRARLGAGAQLRGPAIVVGLDATVWIAPWQAGEVEDHGILVLEEAR